jgi:CBS domain-containing protein
MKAYEIMTKSPACVTPATPLFEAATIMKHRDIGAVPVVGDLDELKLVGILTDRDIAIRHVAKRCAGCTTRDHMTKAPLDVVRVNDDIEDVIDLLEHAQLRRVPVVNDGGFLLGMIAQADIATHYGPGHPEKIEELLETVSRPGEHLHEPLTV